mgnify:CR=1 FL=1
MSSNIQRHDMQSLHKKYPEQAVKAFIQPNSYRELAAFLRIDEAASIGMAEAVRRGDSFACTVIVHEKIRDACLGKQTGLATMEDIKEKVTAVLQEAEAAGYYVHKLPLNIMITI